MALSLAACAAVPSSKTVEVPSVVIAPMAAELLKIGPVVAPPPTEKLYAPLAEREPYAGVQVRRDVRYGADDRNLLDVFTPDKPQAGQPVLVFVHGGGFVRGARRTGDSPFYDNIMLWAVRQGMVGVNMTYRLAPAHPWPAAQQDIQSALKWVRENMAGSGGNPQHIILMGHSAGAAHVAQYVAHPQFHVVPGSGLAGAVLLSGIFDPSTAVVNPSLQAYFGQDAAQYPTRSAVPGLVAAKVPLLLVYAELDPPRLSCPKRTTPRRLVQGRSMPRPLQTHGPQPHVRGLFDQQRGQNRDQLDQAVGGSGALKRGLIRWVV